MTMENHTNFNIHNLVTIKVDQNTPSLNLLKDMFQPFITEDEIPAPDLVISGDLEEFEDGTYGEVHGESDIFFNYDGVYFETYNIQVFTNHDHIRLNGGIELLVMALPLIDALMHYKNAAMIHALTVAYKGQGLCMPAWGGAGKTTTMAKLMKKDGYAFMGDDWAFLTQEGQLLGFTKPMFIKPYHKDLYPHIFKSKPKPLVPQFLSKPIHSVTTRLHPLVSKYPQLASISRRWSPEHIMVTPQTAFPQGNFETSAPLVGSLFVERFVSSSSDPIFEKKDHTWMTETMIGNFHAEMTRQSRVVLTGMGASGQIPISKYFSDKSRILESALNGKPSYSLRIPKHLGPDEASDIIVEHIEKVLAYAKK